MTLRFSLKVYKHEITKKSNSLSDDLFCFYFVIEIGTKDPDFDFSKFYWSHPQKVFSIESVGRGCIAN